ncbi:D-alanyl-D-alanine carboxypeptidase/D-alanyl-D-alanine-endopeptidase [Prevotella sp. P4-119]|uniref:D-alanyl-D-alanine carboxypeptidase/D-alanyl-D-alanine endopeptidase n=1 Tax=Prevotella sp. P4-119 TaxID=2024218 RepID=UPI000B9764EE|nr:D-alanyl-D-alanine carboxypeptidase/D-alanyl-D-alanine-endopeptidase [Prevotella sp. P4-119]MBS7318491.1 D-alanyl-D-alanine carboxypeptidase/D-alanyl-D-alanine-endopeptidase [Prevotella sp.]MCI7001071.1 D-alanyl-D-alanine carboxypeptidase/D-alanyl-D-alanine-endopeptidase [Prevotella sp.]MEE1140170.1 D-alanyl-D-alanine carboxypeptidase/D-alanyl-D-alanine-endopeptidase [Prevotella sp.]OYP43021.1 D-alanyl-D-alanine carboxypeptidase/D-alanyl-D-alanine-endopeptidase [Prevotella sp. P4-119]
MSKIKIILLLLWAAVAASAQETEEPDTFQVDTIDVALPWPRNIQYRLDSLLRHPMFETSTVGLEVYDLTADSILYKVNEHQMLRPASTMKLLTAITAIDKLGGSYQFRTQLYYTGKVEDHTLTGDLYCVGGFDPRFNIDDMNAFVESIRCMGVDTIRGSIVADRSMKDADLLGEGWCWDDDNPPLSPLTIGRNTQFVDRFIRQLVDDGVVLDVRISDGTLPDSAFHLCSRFHSIDQILLRMMKQSDNFYAEAMFYQLAAHQGHRPARAKDAAAIVKRLISKVGLGHRPYRIADGSGLSLYNYLSADLEVRLLRYAYRNSTVYLHLLPSLPVAGSDGTLRNRMRGSFAADNVKAKTGTLEGVSALAGYCTAANDHRLCFSIINQGVMHTSNARRFQDRVCNALCAP